MTALKKIAGPRTFLLVGDSKLISYANAAVMAAAQVAFVAPLAAARVPAGAVGRLAGRGGYGGGLCRQAGRGKSAAARGTYRVLEDDGMDLRGPARAIRWCPCAGSWCTPGERRRPGARPWVDVRKIDHGRRRRGSGGRRVLRAGLAAAGTVPGRPGSWTAPPAMAGGCRRWRCCAGPALSTGRKVGMGAPRLYMAVAMILVIIKIAQLAIGHQVPLHREHGPHSGARHRPCGHGHEGERSWPRHRPGPDASSRFCGGARARRPGSACRHQAGLLRAALHAAVHAVATAGRRRGHGRSRRAPEIGPPPPWMH